MSSQPPFPNKKAACLWRTIVNSVSDAVPSSCPPPSPSLHPRPSERFSPQDHADHGPAHYQSANNASNTDHTQVNASASTVCSVRTHVAVLGHRRQHERSDQGSEVSKDDAKPVFAVLLLIVKKTDQSITARTRQALNRRRPFH